MNKNELITSVSEASGLSKSDAGKAVDGVIGAITGALKSGGDVRIVGFGTFSVAHRKFWFYKDNIDLISNLSGTKLYYFLILQID